MAKDPAERPATAADFMDALEVALDGEPAAAGPPTAVTAPVAAAPPRPPTRSVRVAPTRPKRRWPGMAALGALAVVAGAAIAIAAGTGGKGDGGASTAKHTTTAAHSTSTAKSQPKTQATQSQATTQAPAQPAQTTQPAQSTQTPPPAQAKSDDPVALNDQGFALIGQGKPNDAVAPLQRSVEAFRAQGRKGEVGYAYALYNLGNALRLSGRPADAIPFLQERLQVSNYKRGIVEKELRTAQQQAGQKPSKPGG
jgi:serine/threonine-protein kinase